VPADPLGQVKEGAGGIKEDRFDHKIYRDSTEEPKGGCQGTPVRNFTEEL
jgi:hypothetical protein